MDRIEDKEAGLWAIHFPNYQDDPKSKTLCLAMYYMITDKAETIVSYGDWSDKIHHACAFLGVPKDQFYVFAKENKEL